MNTPEMHENIRAVHHEKGVTYYSREIERRVFFYLTIAMLGLGILYKVGWL